MLEKGEVKKDDAGYYMLRSISDPPPDPDEEYVEHPFLEHGPGADWGGGVQWHDGSMIRVPRKLVALWTGGFVPESHQAYWSKVQGTSMEPWLPDQSPIFVIICREVQDNGRYVMYLDDVDAEVIKRVERIGGGVLLLLSDNPAHPSRPLYQLEGDMWEDRQYGIRLRLRIQGRVVFPADTPQAILSTFAKYSQGRAA